ncbi:unnamed protein product, partial [Phaeothamnion confervicola]
QDLLLVAISFIIVFAVIWCSLESFFLTLCAMYGIIISFPMGIFVWSVLATEEYVTYLMYLGIFIILGIGADDVFVFYDTWRQARAQHQVVSGSLYTRFAWTYHKAAASMFLTSATTFVCFVT